MTGAGLAILAGQRLARIPAAPNGPPPMDESQRPLGFRHSRKTAGEPTEWDGKILVPFPVESALCGVKKPVAPDQRLWYRRSFRCSAAADGRPFARCTSARSTGRPPSGSTARKSAAPRRLRPVHVRRHRRPQAAMARRADRRASGIPPTQAASRAASRSASPTASCTRRPPASGRPSGSSRCRAARSTSLKIMPDVDAGAVADRRHGRRASAAAESIRPRRPTATQVTSSGDGHRRGSDDRLDAAGRQALVPRPIRSSTT